MATAKLKRNPRLSKIESFKLSQVKSQSSYSLSPPLYTPPPETVLGRQVLAWTKVDFVDYYADLETCAPAAWYFHTMKAWFYVLYFGPGVAVPSMRWFQPPGYCGEHGEAIEAA